MRAQLPLAVLPTLPPLITVLLHWPRHTPPTVARVAAAGPLPCNLKARLSARRAAKSFRTLVCRVREECTAHAMKLKGNTLAAKVASSITDERTMAAWILPPTAIRAAARQQGDEKPARIPSAEIEEHVRDPDSGSTLRCDVTLRGKKTAVVAIEMKRPEVADVRDPVMTVDAHKKAASRGLVWYGTCNFKEIALWSTHDGPRPTSPLFVHPLVTDLTHSAACTADRSSSISFEP